MTLFRVEWSSRDALTKIQIEVIESMEHGSFAYKHKKSTYFLYLGLLIIKNIQKFQQYLFKRRSKAQWEHKQNYI
jgi:hypothetical protein